MNKNNNNDSNNNNNYYARITMKNAHANNNLIMIKL